MFWMWGKRAQEVGMPTKETKEKRGSGTATRGMGEGEEAQWREGAAFKGSGNVHGRVDYTQRSGNVYGVQRMRL